MARYVDADILYKLAEESKTNSFHYADANIDDLSELIDEAFYTTAEVQEVKHGNWISRGHWCVACSYCGKMFHDYDCSISGGNYCPNCGARMDGDVK